MSTTYLYVASAAAIFLVGVLAGVYGGDITGHTQLFPEEQCVTNVDADLIMCVKSYSGNTSINEGFQEAINHTGVIP